MARLFWLVPSPSERGLRRGFSLRLSIVAAAERPYPQILSDLTELAQNVIDQVRVGADLSSIEQSVLEGLEASAEGRDQLSQMLELGRVPKNEAEVVADVLAQVEQKLSFFQGCTARRSALPHGRQQDGEAEAYAQEAEQLAVQARTGAALDWLIQAYKRTELLEARIAEVRDANKSGTGPEPRVLDLPRTRLLVARRVIGAAVIELDEPD